MQLINGGSFISGTRTKNKSSCASSFSSLLIHFTLASSVSQHESGPAEQRDSLWMEREECVCACEMVFGEPSNYHTFCTNRNRQAGGCNVKAGWVPWYCILCCCTLKWRASTCNICKWDLFIQQATGRIAEPFVYIRSLCLRVVLFPLPPPLVLIGHILCNLNANLNVSLQVDNLLLLQLLPMDNNNNNNNQVIII